MGYKNRFRPKGKHHGSTVPAPKVRDMAAAARKAKKKSAKRVSSE
jgi:hypothetical protein